MKLDITVNVSKTRRRDDASTPDLRSQIPALEKTVLISATKIMQIAEG